MSFSWWRKRVKQKSGPRSRRHPFQLGLIRLEDRCLLSTGLIAIVDPSSTLGVLPPAPVPQPVAALLRSDQVSATRLISTDAANGAGGGTQTEVSPVPVQLPGLLQLPDGDRSAAPTPGNKRLAFARSDSAPAASLKDENDASASPAAAAAPEATADDAMADAAAGPVAGDGAIVNKSAEDSSALAAGASDTSHAPSLAGRAPADRLAAAGDSGNVPSADAGSDLAWGLAAAEDFTSASEDPTTADNGAANAGSTTSGANSVQYIAASTADAGGTTEQNGGLAAGVDGVFEQLEQEQEAGREAVLAETGPTASDQTSSATVPAREAATIIVAVGDDPDLLPQPSQATVTAPAVGSSGGGFVARVGGPSQRDGPIFAVALGLIDLDTTDAHRYQAASLVVVQEGQIDAGSASAANRMDGSGWWGIVSSQFMLVPSLPKKYPATVLLAVGDETTRDAMSVALVNEGYLVLPAGTGHDVMGLLRTPLCPIDVVLLDINLPDVSGMHLCARLRELYPRLPVMVCCSEGDSVDVTQLLKLGVHHYFLKPIAVRELLATVKALLP